MCTTFSRAIHSSKLSSLRRSRISRCSSEMACATCVGISEALCERRLPISGVTVRELVVILSRDGDRARPCWKISLGSCVADTVSTNSMSRPDFSAMDVVTMSCSDIRNLCSECMTGRRARTDDPELPAEEDRTTSGPESEDSSAVEVTWRDVGREARSWCASRSPREAFRTSNIVHSPTIRGMS